MLASVLQSGRAAPRVSRIATPLIIGIGLYGLGAPALAIAHELIVLASAAVLSDLTWLLSWCGVLRVLPFDPIYTGALLLTVGGIEPRGLALAGPLGALLHALAPSMFEAPDLAAPDAWA